MKRSAFALMEVLIVIGILGAVTALSVPLYREYQIRSDLDNAAQQAQQGLSRAKLLSQLGEQDAQWGFYVPSGTLYKGETYATRDTQFDEVYPMPSTIAVSGLMEVAYGKVEGVPSDTGDIVLRALNNDERIIQVTIAVDSQTVAANQGDVMTICYLTQTIQIPDATWPSYQGQGATMGACAGGSVSSAGGATSSAAQSSAAGSVASSAASSAGGGGGGGVGGGTNTCTDKFTLAADGTMTTQAAVSVTFLNMFADITFGAGGPVVPVHACYSVNNGSTWTSLYGGNGNCKGNGNAYGNAVKPAGTDTKTVSIAANKNVAVQISGRYKQHGWLAFDEKFASNDSDGHIIALINGDQIGNFPGFGSQTPLKEYLQSIGKADAQGQVTIGSCEVILATELSDLNTSASDFQDDVMLVTFQ